MSEKMPDEKIVSEMLMAFVDGRLWPQKTVNYGFGPDDVRGMQNVLALLVGKGYERTELAQPAPDPNAPKRYWMIEQPELDEDDDYKTVHTTDLDVYPGCKILGEYVLKAQPAPASDAVDALKTASLNPDWGQVLANGGPPCFHLDGDKFCLRAKRWPGHDNDSLSHRYVSLHDLFETILAALRSKL